MPLRKTFLRLMLWSLAITTAAGVLAMLVEAGDLVWRVIGTCVVMAVACGLMMPISGMIDREKSRSAGMMGTAWVIGEFILSLLLIWEVPSMMFNLHWEEELALTLVLSSIAALLIMGLLKLRHDPNGRVAGRPGIVVTLVAFLASMAATWLPDLLRNMYGWPAPGYSSYSYHDYQLTEHLWLTAAAIAIFGGLPVLCLIGYGVGQPRHWRWIGVDAGIVAGAMWLVDIWASVGSNPGYVCFCVLTGAASIVAYTNLVLMCPLTPPQNWVRQGAILAAIVTVTLIDSMVVSEKLFHISLWETLIARLQGAAGIVTGCATIALLVLGRINRGVDYEPVAMDAATVDLHCPRCKRKQSIPIGASSCAACGLRISIRVEEPRCPKCGYLLFQLTSNRCPECGMMIEAMTATA
jgi:ribosomal protein L37E